MSTLSPVSLTPQVQKLFNNAKLVDASCELSRSQEPIQSTNLSSALDKISSCKKRLKQLTNGIVYECGTILFEKARLRHRRKDGRVSIDITKVCIGTSDETIKKLQKSDHLSDRAVSFQTVPHPVDFYLFCNRQVIHIKLNPEKQADLLSIPLDSVMGDIWDVHSIQIAHLADQLIDNSLLVAFGDGTKIIPIPTKNDLVNALAHDLDNVRRNLRKI